MQEAAPTLHIYLFGGFHLVAGETPITGIDLPRMQSLLAYLLLHSGVPQSRSHVAYLFWPDSTDSQAHTNLRNIVHKLRQTLPNADTFLQIERQTLFWKPSSPESPWIFDVLDFERAIDEANGTKDTTRERLALTRAATLYRGDLLPSCYDEWLLPERDRLRQMLLKALERLINLQEQERDYASAIATAHSLLRYDPLQEATYRQLMRLYAASGDRAAALRMYHACFTVLEQELAAQPSKVTREMYERLLQSEDSLEEHPQTQPTFVAAVPMVGRQREWTQLQTAWRETTTGRPHLFLLAGEAGIGKTRLAEEFLTWVGRQGLPTAIARCYAAGGSLAYGPVATWLRSEALRASLRSLADLWFTEVARILPNLLAERPQLSLPHALLESWQRQHFFEALVHALLQSKQPLLLLLDDVQWCDRETIEWLHYLLHFDPKAPLLLVCTARSEEMATEHPLTTFLLHLRRDALITEVTLEPLTADETASLSSHLSGEDLDPAIVNAVYEETEGNPLFVVETLRAGAVEKVKTGHLSHEASSFRFSPLLPATVQAVISSRFAQLSSSAREVMSLASVIGRAFTFEVLARASGMDEDALVLGLDELWQRRIVREQGSEAYDFSHDKLREQAYASLSTAKKRLLHRKVGNALEVLYASDENALNAMSGRIAVHYEQAGAIEQAITYYLRTAEEAQRVYANVDALTTCKKVLHLLEQGSFSGVQKQEWRQEIAAQCHERIGDLLMLSGKIEEGRESFQHALALLPAQQRIQRASIYRKIAKAWELQVQFPEALQACTAAEAALGEVSSASSARWWHEWIELQDEMLQIHGSQLHAEKMAAITDKLRPIIQEHGTPVQRAEFFLSSALLAAASNRYRITEEMLANARAGVEAYKALGIPVKVGWSHGVLGMLYWLDDRLIEAEEQARASLQLGEQTGDALLHMKSHNQLANIYRKYGRVQEVRRFASLALEESRVMRLPVHNGSNFGNLLWAAWREGNLSEAETFGQAALNEWQELPFLFNHQWIALLPLIAIARSQDRIADAVNYAQRLLSPDQQRLPIPIEQYLEQTVRAWNAERFDAVRTHLRQLVVVSQEIGYL